MRERQQSRKQPAAHPSVQLTHQSDIPDVPPATGRMQAHNRAPMKRRIGPAVRLATAESARLMLSKEAG